MRNCRNSAETNSGHTSPRGQRLRLFSSTSVLPAASRPKAICCQSSRGLKLVAETYLCIRNEREEQTPEQDDQPESEFQPATHPLCGWMREVARHAACWPCPQSTGPDPRRRSG